MLRIVLPVAISASPASRQLRCAVAASSANVSTVAPARWQLRRTIAADIRVADEIIVIVDVVVNLFLILLLF